MAWRLSRDYPNDLFDNLISLYHIERGFDPTRGFVLRTGIWQTRGHINYMPRPHFLGLRRLDIQLYVVWNSGYSTDRLARYRFPDRCSLSRPLNGALAVKAVHRLAP